MKTFFILIALTIFSIPAQSQQQGKYFFVKSGHIEYKLGGNTSGTKSVWFDNYGLLMYTITESTTTVKLMGFKNTTSKKEVEIRKGNRIWTADLLTKTGTKMSIEMQTGAGEKMTKAKTAAQLDAMERKTITDMGGKLEGYETFLGRKCLKFTWGTTKFLQYKGIPLTSDVSEMGITYTETATSFETNIAIPASKFDVPKNITFEEVGEMTEILNNQEK